MNESLHPAASHHLPSFITAPGETDVLMVVMAVILVIAVLGFGSLFFRLHTLPERMAHRSHKLQFEIVAVLGLLALFTHIHLFWVAGLLLALIDIPDFGGPLKRIAGSTEKLAGLGPGEGAVDLPHETAVEVPHETGAVVEREAPVPATPKVAAAGTRK
ncbi:MAG: hypothetical protein QOD94_3313 [Alphaproteobacteria bacterium]|nr:hypothetical protein [Alphaproteobacteria bacterium]